MTGLRLGERSVPYRLSFDGWYQVSAARRGIKEIAMRSIAGNHGAAVKVITIKKADLIPILRKNQQEHEREYNTALAAWRKDVTDFAARLAADPTPKVLEQGFKLRPPTSHVAEYARTIQMLTLDVEDTVELDARSFAQYVEDEWDWKDEFAATAGMYLDRARG